ncbi:unnamed protein product [Pleuronectes platessa]|uniref:Uncharacterized protein n=1 Tax=Pleuronectes platessa TaxID=8262 RepID=A0A9N7V9N4_PLEPL|nr:unnamed protein product [Pleuronectes platessa]
MEVVRASRAMHKQPSPLRVLMYVNRILLHIDCTYGLQSPADLKVCLETTAVIVIYYREAKECKDGLLVPVPIKKSLYKLLMSSSHFSLSVLRLIPPPSFFKPSIIHYA